MSFRGTFIKLPSVQSEFTGTGGGSIEDDRVDEEGGGVHENKEEFSSAIFEMSSRSGTMIQTQRTSDLNDNKMMSNFDRLVTTTTNNYNAAAATTTTTTTTNSSSTEDKSSYSASGQRFVQFLEDPGNKRKNERKETVRRGEKKKLSYRDSRRPRSARSEEELTHTRRAEVSAEVLTTNSSKIRRNLVKKSEEAMALLTKVTQTSELFMRLPAKVQKECAESFESRIASKGEYLIKEGDAGDLFFVLESGQCVAFKQADDSGIFVDDNESQRKILLTYEPGGSFGELALLFNTPRQATVQVISDTATLWTIDRKLYNSIQVQYKINRQEEFKIHLQKLKFTEKLEADGLSRLLDAVEEVTYNENDIIMKEGERGDTFYVILEGNVKYTQEKKGEVGSSGPGSVFGEAALSKDELRAATVIAQTKVVCMCLVRQKLEEGIGRVEELFEAAKEVFIEQKEKIQANFKYQLQVKFEDLDTRFKKAPVRWGTMETITTDIGSGTSTSALKGASSSSSSSAATTPKKDPEPTTPGGIRRMNGGFFNNKNDDSNNSSRKDTSKSSSTPQEDEKGEIILGVGTFGKVFFVKHKQSSLTYAMKRLNKSWIVENGLEQHVIDERQVMTLLDHPFILKLHNSYWDTRYVYLLLELCLGGELFAYLRRAKKFPERHSRFYAASIVEAFAHLHSKSIVYRDLKPENIMLDAEGYVKLVDFGLAKIVRGRTWTLCGTPEYLAPEIVLSKGHNKAVDYWALGVLIYELVVGEVPFSAEENLEIFKKIIDNCVDFPKDMTPSCKDIIRGLMRSSQLTRLGNTRQGIQAIRNCSWFSGFDFASLLARKENPPYVPKVLNHEDTSNFESYADFDEEPPECDWRPLFPYEVYEGKTQFAARRIE